jgi:IS30 family transposase
MVDFPNDDDMRISHETIYRALYLQGRGGLKRELTRYLRTQRPKRRPQGRKSRINSGKLRDMVNISERPPEVADGAIPGHWEGDLLCGKKNRSAVATLVERQTRFTQLVALGQNRSADYLAQALARQIQLLPTHLWRSLTWDQGREMGSHTKFTISTGVDVYFCDPRSPWQRGTNENTNGLLRQYLPKGTDLSKVSQAQLDKIAEELNGRPRQTLNWRTPSEMLITLLR